MSPRDHTALMAKFDHYVYNHPWKAVRGYHEDQVAPYYAPVVHQNRAEFSEFLYLCSTVRSSSKLVQIGMGITGGAHYAFRLIFDLVVSIELDGAHLENYLRHNAVDGAHDQFIAGNSADPKVIECAYSLARGCDVLFIDGGHSYEDVASDWMSYRDIVRPGGLIAFHDTAPHMDLPPELGVVEFIRTLAAMPDMTGGVPVHHFQAGADQGVCCGISYYYVR